MYVYIYITISICIYLHISNPCSLRRSDNSDPTQNSCVFPQPDQDLNFDANTPILRQTRPSISTMIQSLCYAATPFFSCTTTPSLTQTGQSPTQPRPSRTQL